MPLTTLPEVHNHESLLSVLALIRLEVEARHEDVTNLAAWSTAITERVELMKEEIQALDVDVNTAGNLAMLTDLLLTQTQAAGTYKSCADNSNEQAFVAARTARRGHDLIQHANDDSDAPMAKNVFYNAE